MTAKIDKLPVIIAGLGNPGADYHLTPHNLGFLAVDEFARRNDFPPFEMKIDGLLTTEKAMDGIVIILAKPQTFMNKSGLEVAKLLKQRKLAGKKNYPHLWVVNDDLDLPFKKIRIAKNRGAAGHKGVQSIIDQLKTKDFIRFRVGIKKPELASGKTVPEKFVLKKFRKTDETALAKVIEKTVQAIETALSSGLDKAMTEFN